MKDLSPLQAAQILSAISDYIADDDSVCLSTVVAAFVPKFFTWETSKAARLAKLAKDLDSIYEE